MYDTLFANPQVLANDWMTGAGVTPQGSGGLYDVYQQLSQVMPPLWYLSQTGGAGGGSEADLGQFLDFADAFMNQMSTPGGGAIDPSVIGNLFNAERDVAAGRMLNDPEASPEQQAQRLLGLMSAGMSGMAPGAASGYMGDMQALANAWLGNQARAGKGQGGTFQSHLSRKVSPDLFR